MPSSMAALARPVRSVLNSRCSASMAPCMRWVTSLITSLIMLSSLCRFVGHDRSDVLAEQRPADVPLLPQRKNVDGDLAAASQIDRRGVHHLQPVGEDALVGEPGDFLGGRIL